MNYRLHLLLLLALSMLSLASSDASAAESYDNCVGTIASLPTTINSSGTWCLKQDLATAMTTGNAITIASDNVTIDCNDFKIDGLAAGAGTATIGITASNRLNATVRHCNIRGFFQGIRFLGTGGGHVVEDNRIDSNTYAALNIQGDGSIVQRNQVIDTGGSTVYPAVYAIYTTYSVDVLDNTISAVTARVGGGGNAFGIYTASNADGSVSENRVRAVLKDGAGASYGIYNLTSGRMTMRNNDLVGDGSIGSAGITCSNALGRVKNNVINGFATFLKNCGDAGSNDQTH